MKKILILSTFVIALLPHCTQQQQAQQDACLQSFKATKIEDTDSYKKTILMPINASLPENERINLVVKIPKGFRALQPLDAQLIEFIPENEADEYKWSNIITIQTLIGKGLSAENYLTSLEKFIFSTASNVKLLLRDSSHKSERFSMATLAMEYTMNNRRELMYCRYFSGPYDCSGFQYTIHFNDNMTVESAFDKILHFEKMHVSLMKY